MLLQTCTMQIEVATEALKQRLRTESLSICSAGWEGCQGEGYRDRHLPAMAVLSRTLLKDPEFGEHDSKFLRDFLQGYQGESTRLQVNCRPACSGAHC